MQIDYNDHQTSTIIFNPDNLLEHLPQDNYLIVIDQRVYYLYHDYLTDIIAKATDYLLIEALETNKNQATANIIYEFLFNNQTNRDTTLVSIGGGLIGDLVGYCAATYLRGIPFIQIPTTLLAQVDSSIGAKVAINQFNTKNLIGTFYPAHTIIIDTYFLSKLSTRQFKAGLVELIKHGLIHDEQLINTIEQYPSIHQIKNDTNLITLIKKSLQIKKEYVIQDNLDLGIRHTLNYAHTLAHIIELDSNLNHGESLALAILVNLYGSEHYQRISNLFMKLALIREFVTIDFSKMITDKKRKGNIIKEIFLPTIGTSIIKEISITDLIKLYQTNYAKIKEDYQLFEPYYIVPAQKLKGEITIPPSKSALHRYLIASALAQEKTTLTNVTSLNDDVKTTIKVLQHLNTKVSYENNSLIITPHHYSDLDDEVYFNESASTLRMMMLFLPDKKLLGHDSLKKRPLTTYLKLFANQNIAYETNDEYLINFHSALQADTFIIEDNISSQFISGLLFYLPTLTKDSKIVLKTLPVSLPYIKMTIATLKDFNIEIKTEDYLNYYIKGNQTYHSKGSYSIEQDYSARSFFEVAKSFNDIHITNPLTPSLQGDYQLIDIINNKKNSVDLTDLPDSAPIMSIYYSYFGGILINTNRLIHKESNRLQAIEELLTKANISFNNKDNKLEIKPGAFKGNTYNTYHDHRITMSLIIASLIAQGPIIINEITSINKSFPTFINEFEKLGGFIDEQ